MIHRSGIVGGRRVHETALDRSGYLEEVGATDIEYQASAGDVWLPGVFDSERTARYALTFEDGEIAEAQGRANAEAEARYVERFGAAALADLRARLGSCDDAVRTAALAEAELDRLGGVVTYAMLLAARPTGRWAVDEEDMTPEEDAAPFNRFGDCRWCGGELRFRGNPHYPDCEWWAAHQPDQGRPE